MNSEEKYLRERFGKQSGFRVPDGYFEQLAARYATNASGPAAASGSPQRSPRTIVLRLRWIACAAAIAVVLALSAIAIFQQQQPEAAPTAAATDDNAEEMYIEYAGLDNTDIYAYLAEN